MRAEDFSNNEYLQALSVLTIHEPDRSCADLIRTRCHARISVQRRSKGVMSPAAAQYCRRILEPSLVVLVSAVFLCEVLHRALMLYGF